MKDKKKLIVHTFNTPGGVALGMDRKGNIINMEDVVDSDCDDHAQSVQEAVAMTAKDIDRALALAEVTDEMVKVKAKLEEKSEELEFNASGDYEYCISAHSEEGDYAEGGGIYVGCQEIPLALVRRVHKLSKALRSRK